MARNKSKWVIACLQLVIWWLTAWTIADLTQEQICGTTQTNKVTGLQMECLVYKVPDANAVKTTA